jgi:hypothetical protein
VIRWICNHPTAYVNLTGAIYTVPYGIIAWGFYVQMIVLPLWWALALGVLYNVLCTWARVRVARPARKMDRQNTINYAVYYDPSAYEVKTPRNGASRSVNQADR